MDFFLDTPHINQPHTGGYAKDVLPIIESLTSHLERNQNKQMEMRNPFHIVLPFY